MATEELTLRIRGDIRDIKRDFRTVEQDGDRAARGVGDSFERAGRRVKAAFGGIGRSLGQLRNAGLAAAAAAAAFGALAQRSLAAAESINDMAIRADVSAEFLQELRLAADQNGASARDFDDAISRLNRRLGLFAQSGGGPAAAAFDQLGLSARITSGELQNSEQVFNAAVAALEDVESAAERSALASQLFGEDSGPRLVQLLSRGTEGINELRQAFRDAGLVLEGEFVSAGAEANAELRLMRQQVGTEFSRAINENAGDLANLARSFATLAINIVEAGAALSRFLNLQGGLADRDPAEAQRSLQETAQMFTLRATGARDGDIRTEESMVRRAIGTTQGGELNRTFRDMLRESDDISATYLEIANILRARAEEVRIASEAATAAPLLGSAGGGGGGGGGGGTAGAFNPTPRVNPRTLDAAAKSAALAEFAATSKEIGQQIAAETATELERENQRIADTFGRGAADGVISALDGNLDQFLARMFRQAAFNGLSEAFSSLAGSLTSGSGGGFLGGLARFGANLLGGGKATGGTARGLTLVGEQGPELVNLGGMANVMTANMTRMALAGGRAAAPSAPGSQIVNLSTTVIDQSRGVDVSVRQISERDIQIMIDERAPRAVAGQFENQNSPVARSMRSNFQITPRRGNV